MTSSIPTNSVSFSAESIDPDPDARRLSEWSTSSSSSPPRTTITRGGLVLVAEWGWAELDNDNGGLQYSKLSKKLANSCGDSLYVYPAHATHVTIATLSNFKRPDAPRSFAVDDHMDAQILTAWGDALERVLQSAHVEPFTIYAERIELSPGAAFIHFNDPSGTVERLRSLVTKARDKDPSIAALVRDYSDGGKVDGDQVIRGSVMLPNIIHSSFARFAFQGQPDVIARNFNKIADGFQTFPVRITRLTLANECVPYMHQDREEGTVRIFNLERRNEFAD